MSYSADVALATDDEGRAQIQPFVDALPHKPSITKVGEYTVFHWQYVRWDVYFDLNVIKFEEEMEKLPCFEFVYHGEDTIEWKVGDDTPGILFTGIGYFSENRKELLN